MKKLITVSSAILAFSFVSNMTLAEKIKASSGSIDKICEEKCEKASSKLQRKVCMDACLVVEKEN